eukprot:scaffold14.g1111.t1
MASIHIEHVDNLAISVGDGSQGTPPVNAGATTTASLGGAGTTRPSALPLARPPHAGQLSEAELADDRDDGTPDAWIRRNPAMIRLTSNHPLNSEPPLSQLLEAGFHTPVALHYVRRRELQLVKRTQGFAWGHSAIATSEWTGAPLHEVLLAVGVQPGARFVHFSGPPGEVAAGDLVYATSIPLWKGLDPLSEVLLAWRHNGHLLAPDHGYPLRLVVPEESRNHYHLRDNKVLPADVDQDKATREDWWYRPEFVCYNLNIGSVIAAPAHGEALPLPSSGEDDDGTFEMRGFAHTGAGHLVIRVELSLDGGDNWRQTHITEREPGVPVSHLAQAEEVRVRAWDDTMNTQPERPTWNLIGMMNNCCFIVKIYKEEIEGGQQQLRFVHPVPNGRDPGGAGGTPEQREEEEAAAKAGKGWDQLREYDWDEARGRRDASSEFDSIHSSDARMMTLEYLIGRLKGMPPPWEGAGPSGRAPQAGAPVPDAAAEGEEADEPALKKGKVLKAKLEEKEEITHDTRRFRFALPRQDQRLGLPVGHHITVTAQIKEEKVIRPYTPVTLDHERGYFDLVGRRRACVLRAGARAWVARREENNAAAIANQGGKMSQHMDRLAVGDTIDVRGPYGEFTWLGGGRYTYKGREWPCSRMNLVGGGTGITPLYQARSFLSTSFVHILPQVMRSLLEDPQDHTSLALVFANKTPQDVLLRRRLQRMGEECANRLHIWYSVDKSTGDSWHYSVGFINKELLQDHLYSPEGKGGSKLEAAQGSSGGCAAGGGSKDASGQGQEDGGSCRAHEAGSSEESSGPGQEDKGGEPCSAKEREGGGSARGGGSSQGGDEGEEGDGQGGGEQGGGGRTIVLVCGPPPMVDRAVLPALKELGYQEDQIVVL